MLAIIGTYRKDEYIPRLLESLDTFATGLDRYVFIDDSNDEFMATYLDQHGHVIQTFGEGYGAAMQAAVAVGQAENSHVVWLEEDFELTAPVDFEALASDLEGHRNWAQVVLQRQAWYPREIESGGILEAVRDLNQEVNEQDGYYTHRSFFSCNPSVWRKDIWQMGWPVGDNSEYRFYQRLKKYGYQFAMTKEILCHHSGVRSGKGY